MQYEIILFDADDTLFDYVKAEIYALTSTFEEFGIFIMPSQLESYRKINQLLWDEYEKGAINLGRLRTERFRRLFIEYNLNLDPTLFSGKYLKYLGEGSFLVKGASELCKYLLNNGYRIAIITNGIRKVQLDRIRKSELCDAFDEIIISEDAGYQKPHKGIFDFAFQKLNIQNKEQCLIVGDSLSSDIQGGINYGVDTCWFNSNKKQNDTSIKPRYEIKELKDLIGILEDDS